MYRTLALVIALCYCACAAGQGLDIHVREARIVETSPLDYFRHIAKTHEEKVSGKSDSFKDAMKVTPVAERETIVREADSITKAWQRTVFESGGTIPLWGNVFVEFDFRYDSSKMYLAARNPSRILNTKTFVQLSYDIHFADGSVLKYQKPFATSFDELDMFVLLDGSMEALRFDKDGQPSGTHTVKGDARLLKKMQSVPVRSVTMYYNCDARFRKYAGNCRDNEVIIWSLPDESGEIMMDCLNRLCRETKKERR